MYKVRCVCVSHKPSHIITGRGTVIFAGDIVLDSQDAQNRNANPTNSFTNSPAPQQLEESRRTIFCMADWILPGHGPMFAVTPEHKRNYNCQTMTNTFGGQSNQGGFGQNTFQPFGQNQNQFGSLQSLQFPQQSNQFPQNYQING
jgi:glyoxylase-like metal-dependent hydrolase (beta-lactamase superfamily II)